MEITDKKKHGFIEVWLTRAEQQTIDREKLTHELLAAAEKKCKVVYFLSGSSDLTDCMKQLLTKNL